MTSAAVFMVCIKFNKVIREIRLEGNTVLKPQQAAINKILNVNIERKQTEDAAKLENRNLTLKKDLRVRDSI